MNINNVCLSNDIIELIINQLPIKYKIIFSQIDKNIYHEYNHKLKKYKIYNYINNDYLQFYQSLQDNHYTNDEMSSLLKLSIQNIPTVYKNKICGFYDLKYIFEMLFITQNIITTLVTDQEIQKLNIHFYIHFYPKIKEILHENRNTCKKNIENNKYLISLQKDFVGFYKSNIMIRSIGLPRYQKSDKKYYHLL